MARARKTNPPGAAGASAVVLPLPAEVSSACPQDFNTIAVSAESVKEVEQALVSQEWLPWHDDVVRLMMQGQDPAAIAHRLGISYDTVSCLIASPSFAAALAKSRVGVQQAFMARMERLWELSDDIITAMKAVVQCFVEGEPLPSGEVPKFRDIKDMFKDTLDRAGLRAPEKHVLEIFNETNQTVTHREELSYERRLKLVKDYKDQGLEIPSELGILEIAGEKDG